MDKLWVITQSGYDRLAIDNYYRKTVIGADFPFSIVTLIDKEEVTLGVYENVYTADAILKMMDEHLVDVYDKLANKRLYYISDVFFKMPSWEEAEMYEDEEFEDED